MAADPAARGSREHARTHAFTLKQLHSSGRTSNRTRSNGDAKG